MAKWYFEPGHTAADFDVRQSTWKRSVRKKASTSPLKNWPSSSGSAEASNQHTPGRKHYGTATTQDMTTMPRDELGWHLVICYEPFPLSLRADSSGVSFN